jgi:hypothetical protein
MSKYKVQSTQAKNRNTVHFKRESYVQNKFATYVPHSSLLKMSKYKVQSTQAKNRNTVHFKRESYVQNKFATYVPHSSLLKMSKYKNLKKTVKTV